MLLFLPPCMKTKIMIVLIFRWPCWFSANVFCFTIQCVCVRVRVCVQGVNLALAKDKGQLVFLEGLNESVSVLIPREGHANSCALGFLRYTDTPYTSQFNFCHRLSDLLCI